MYFSIPEVVDRIVNTLTSCKSHKCGLLDALGRVVAHDIIAPRSEPETDLALYDGYAIGQCGLESYVIQSEDPHEIISANHAVKVFAGAYLPKHTQTVLSSEAVLIMDEINIIPLQPNHKGQGMQLKASDCEEGACIIPKGTVIKSHHIAQLSGLQLATIDVIKKPRIGILVGDRVHEGGKHSAYKPSTAISMVMVAFIEEAGAEPVMLGDVSHMMDSTSGLNNVAHVVENYLQDLDMVIASGSFFSLKFSHQLHNPFWDIFIRHGIELEAMTVKLGDQESIILGQMTGKTILGMPGGMVSHLLKLSLFLKPAINTMLGIITSPSSIIQAKLDQSIDFSEFPREVHHGKLRYKNGQILVVPVDDKKATSLADLAANDCLILLDAPKYQGGETVSVLRLR